MLICDRHLLHLDFIKWGEKTLHFSWHLTVTLNWICCLNWNVNYQSIIHCLQLIARHLRSVGVDIYLLHTYIFVVREYKYTKNRIDHSKIRHHKTDINWVYYTYREHASILTGNYLSQYKTIYLYIAVCLCLNKLNISELLCTEAISAISRRCF